MSEYSPWKIIILLLLGSLFALISGVILGNVNVLLDFGSSLIIGLFTFLIAGIFWISAMVGLKGMRKKENPRTVKSSLPKKVIVKKPYFKRIERPRIFEYKPKEFLVGSKKLSKYHRPDCRWAKGIKPENKILFENPEEAERNGYVLCKVCKPS